MQEIVKDRIKFIDSHPQHSVTHDMVLFGNYIFTLVRNLKTNILYYTEHTLSNYWFYDPVM